MFIHHMIFNLKFSIFDQLLIADVIILE